VDPLFSVESELLRPSELARGPWSRDALHGGPVAALLARTAESAPAPGPMHPARLTIELLRPVGFAPLRASARVLRPGRKVQLVEASLHTGDTEMARATLLRIRSEPVPMPETVAGGDVTPPPGPDSVPPTRPAWRGGDLAYHSHATEHRVVRGSWGELGPCTDWIRLRSPLLAGEALTPLQRVAAAADFGNGISSALPYGAYRFINPDLTIHLHRLPAGEWVCLDAATYPAANGVGTAECHLYDERGRIGHSAQSLLIERS
jgi:acyl-coenzyme A thioesterase PaaI-like protein